MRPSGLKITAGQASAAKVPSARSPRADDEPDLDRSDRAAGGPAFRRAVLTPILAGPCCTESTPTTGSAKSPRRPSSTKLSEKDVEDWVAAKPEILGEPLLIIGRPVQLDEGKDRIDLLALDKAANLVVIELKRDLVAGAADLQALRYAAQVAQWSYEDVRRLAEGYWKGQKPERGTFAQEVEAGQ